MRATLVEGANGELVGHSTVPQTGDLRKDKPDPVTRLSSGAQFIKDCVIHALLRAEEAVKVLIVRHTLCVSGMFVPGRYQA